MDSAPNGGWYLVSRVDFNLDADSRDRSWQILSAKPVKARRYLLESGETKVKFTVNRRTNAITLDVSGSSDPDFRVLVNSVGDEVYLGNLSRKVSTLEIQPGDKAVAFQLYRSKEEIAALVMEWHLAPPEVVKFNNFTLTGG